MDCIKNKMPSPLSSCYFKSMDEYVSALYKLFVRDFVDNTLIFEDKPVDIIHEEYYEGRERTFWHIISEGDKDSERIPVSGRAEKIPWIKPLLQENCRCDEYRKWKKYHDKTKKYRHYIWCVALNYIVVLEDRLSHFKFITAFPITDDRVRQYDKEYKKYCEDKTKTPT